MMSDGTNESHVSSGLSDTTEGTQRHSRQALLGTCFSVLEGACSALSMSVWKACG